MRSLLLATALLAGCAPGGDGTAAARDPAPITYRLADPGTHWLAESYVSPNPGARVMTADYVCTGPDAAHGSAGTMGWEITQRPNNPANPDRIYYLRPDPNIEILLNTGEHGQISLQGQLLPAGHPGANRCIIRVWPPVAPGLPAEH
jgi:hypothetical protein